ncbi:MAG: ComEC/Rec2 family competence protein [Bacteroidota bacterium]
MWKNSKQKSRNTIASTAFAMSAAVALGILVIAWEQPKNQNHHYETLLTDSPAQWRLKVKAVLKHNSWNHRYQVQAIAINKTQCTGKLLLSIARDSLSAQLAVDDEIMVYTSATTIRPPRNPYQFDYQAYLKKQGIFHEIRLPQPVFLQLNAARPTLRGRAFRFRETLINRLEKYDFGKAELGVIQALILGKRDDLSEATYRNYQDAGAVHILAVSGLHVGLIMLLLQWLLRPIQQLPQGDLLKALIVITLLWTYAFVAGLSPSVVRATTLFSFLAYAAQLNRPTNVYNSIAWSLFFILLIKPLFLFQVGFQLSYAAVIAIAIIYPELQRLWSPRYYLLRKGWQLLSVSIAAQLGVLPMVLFYFHQFPGLFWVSNLIIIPFLGMLLALGFVVLVLAYANSLPPFLADFYNFLVYQMNRIVAWVAQQEAFVFKDIPFDMVHLVFTYLLIGGSFLLLKKPVFKTITLVLISLLGWSGYRLYQNIALNHTEELLLLHQTKNTVLFYQHGNTLEVLATDTLAIRRYAQDFKMNRQLEVLNYRPLGNFYNLNQNDLWIIDSSEMLPSRNPNYLLLSQSPKINLDKLLERHTPKLILADGSNYRSDVQRWKASCTLKDIPFYYTGDEGAYTFGLNE